MVNDDAGWNHFSALGSEAGIFAFDHRHAVPAQDLVGLLGELVDQRMLDRRQHAADLFAVLQHAQPLGRGQHVEREVHRALHASLERVEDFDDLLTTTRTHVRIIETRPDKFWTRKTKVTQVVSVTKMPMVKWSP